MFFAQFSVYSPPPLEFERLLLYPLEISIDILNNIFFLEKPIEMKKASHTNPGFLSTIFN